jgi:hypothetical protein
MSDAASNVTKFSQSVVDEKKTQEQVAADRSNADSYYKKMLGFATEISQENPGIGVDPTSLPKPREDETFKDYTTKTIPEWLAQNKPLIAAYNNFQDPESIQRFQTKLMSSQFASKELVDNIEKIRNEKAAQEAQGTLGMNIQQGSIPTYQAMQETAPALSQYAKEKWGARETPDLSKTQEWGVGQAQYTQQFVPTVDVNTATGAGSTQQAIQQGQYTPGVQEFNKMLPTVQQTKKLGIENLVEKGRNWRANLRNLLGQQMDQTKQIEVANNLAGKVTDDYQSSLRQESVINKAINDLRGDGMLGQLLTADEQIELGQVANAYGSSTTEADLKKLLSKVQTEQKKLEQDRIKWSQVTQLVATGTSLPVAARAVQLTEDLVNPSDSSLSPSAPTITVPRKITSPAVTPATSSTSTATSYLEEVQQRRRRRMGQ